MGKYIRIQRLNTVCDHYNWTSAHISILMVSALMALINSLVWLPPLDLPIYRIETIQGTSLINAHAVVSSDARGLKFSPVPSSTSILRIFE